MSSRTWTDGTPREPTAALGIGTVWAALLAAACCLLAVPPCAEAQDKGRPSLLLALVPERNVFEQQRKYALICDYGCRKLPFDVDFQVMKSYRDVLLSLRKGEAKGAFLGSFLAAYGIEVYGLVPLARPEWKSGLSTYRSVLFKGRSVKATQDVSTWKGLRMVFTDRATSAGYFYPLAYMREQGVKDPKGFFSDISFSGSHDATVWMVARGLADIGAAKDTVFDDYTRRKPDEAGLVEVLHVGGTFPDLTFAVLPSLPLDSRDALRAMFLDMDRTEEGRRTLEAFGARRFIVAGPGDYPEVLKVVDAAGFVLKDVRLEEGEGNLTP